jgi:hypothetical protein
MADRLGALLACVLVCLGASLAAAADAPPVRVAACTVIPETVSRRGALPETIRVSFAVERDSPADLARFTATAPAGAFREFTARGTFARGVVIADRVLSADPGAVAHGLAPGVECLLTYVHFVDGTSWTPARQ